MSFAQVNRDTCLDDLVHRQIQDIYGIDIMDSLVVLFVRTAFVVFGTEEIIVFAFANRGIFGKLVGLFLEYMHLINTVTRMSDLRGERIVENTFSGQ